MAQKHDKLAMISSPFGQVSQSGPLYSLDSAVKQQWSAILLRAFRTRKSYVVLAWLARIAPFTWFPVGTIMEVITIKLLRLTSTPTNGKQWRHLQRLEFLSVAAALALKSSPSGVIMAHLMKTRSKWKAWPPSMNHGHRFKSLSHRSIKISSMATITSCCTP